MGVPVAYVTSTAAGKDDEVGLVLTGWNDAGMRGEIVRWDDPEVDWSSYDAAVVRSTWDYVTRRQEFVAWARRVSGLTRLLNPAPVIERNTDKTYLRDLAERGIPTVPTRWISPGEAPDLMERWPELVVKPSVSAGAKDTVRTASRAQALEHAWRLTKGGRTAMIQPYLDMVESEGETSLIFLGGRFSHAIRRQPMLSARGGMMTMTHRNRPAVREVDLDQVILAKKILGMIPEELLFARVDLVRDARGAPILLELELTEPYLFLRYAPHASRRMAQALRILASR
ncbi:ATP-grasp domain-containing protein [Rhizohabitans arisaemae]|uniref:ATP-grasp domain-containing protein n=1 Tax=Rhizohabitans arisaemae TaxID=2720610 RepID=UPI0024B285E5|nr:hypothetical protein [Rhizohabitans arisaemae]